MQTAIDAIDLHAVQDGLAHLKTGVTAATAAENDLVKSRAERLSALRREAMRHAELETGKLDQRVHALAEEFKQRAAVAQQEVATRAARIQLLYHSSRTALGRRVQAVKDHRISETQGHIMRKRQLRQEQLEQATEAHRRYLEDLLAQRAVRREVRRSVLSSLRPFRLWLKPWFIGTRGNYPPVEMPATLEQAHASLLETPA